MIPEKLSAATAERPSCIACGLFKTCSTPFLKPWIPQNWTRKILGVGEAPGEDEDERTGRPFTGSSGRLLYRMLREAGFKDRDVALVNAVRCRPRRNATPSMRQLRSCRPFLLRVVEQLRPEVVVAFGASAVKSLLDSGTASVTGLRGRALEVRVLPFGGAASDPGVVGEVLHEVSGLHVLDSGRSGLEVVVPLRVTYHPAAILRGATHLERRIVQDLRRCRESDRRELEIVSEVLTDKVLSVDTEYDPNGNLLTLALAGATKARAWDVAYHPGTTQ